MSESLSPSSPLLGASTASREVRRDFPILEQTIYGRRLAYLDNAATTLKPQFVIERIKKHYREETANVHRGIHYLSEQATEAYEEARKNVQSFINASSEREIIFTSGTTASINLVAWSFGRKHFGPGDEVLISHMEHHSNIVPWQILAETTGSRLNVVPIDDRGELVMEEFEKRLTGKTKLVSMVYVSNALGTQNPVKSIIQKAHAAGVPVLLDCAQALPHLPIDVRELDVDFIAFSGHKFFGPTGIGVLYGKEEHLESMPPMMGGGEMISSVTFDKTTYNELPYKFEAGTPHIAGAIGLGAALDYIRSVGYAYIREREGKLLDYGLDALSTIKGLRFIGSARHRSSIISFVLDKIHPHDIGTLVDREGVALRTGHHCTQPVMEHFGVPATARASIAFYNDETDIDQLVEALRRTQNFFLSSGGKQ